MNGENKRVLLIGHGYIAHALAKELAHRNYDFRDNKIPASKLTYDMLRQMIQIYTTDLVVNCAAFIPQPTVDGCKNHPRENIMGNVAFPTMLADACDEEGIPLIHVSTGCLFDESKEWTEDDTPTRGFDGYCGAYVGAKLLAEHYVLQHPKTYVLRIRLPFDEIDHPRNYLSKLANFPTVFDHVNSLTHRGDFARAALDLWEKDAEFGIYHVVNPGVTNAINISRTLRDVGIRELPYPTIGPTKSTGCILSTEKLRKVGVFMRDVGQSVSEAINKWVDA